MNKEEMLKTLKNIQDKMTYELENDNVESRMEELDQLKREIPLLNAEVRDLENRIKNDMAYTNKFTALNDEAIGDIFRTDINRAMANIANTRKNISDANQRTASMNETITKNKAEIAKLKEENLINGEMLRELGNNPDPEDERIIAEDLAASRSRISFLDKQNETIANKLVQDIQYITSQNTVLTSYVNDLTVSEANLENFNNEIIKTPILNEVKRGIDKENLKNLIYERDMKVNREQIISLDYYNEFSKIVSDLETDKINIQESRQKVSDLMKRIPDGYFIEDINARDRELAVNSEAQKSLVLKIRNLENKLADDNNYLASALVAERNNAELARWENVVRTYEAEKPKLDAEKLRLKSEIDANNAMVMQADEEIAAKGHELRMLGNDITPEAEAKINKELEDLREIRTGYVNNVNEFTADSATLDNNIKVNEDKIYRSNSVLYNLQNSLEKRNNINSSQRRLDELALSNYRTSLSGLKNRENFVKKSLLEEMTQTVEQQNTAGVGPDAAAPQADAGEKEETNQASTEPKETTQVYEDYNDDLLNSVNRELNKRGIPAQVVLPEKEPQVEPQTNNQTSEDDKQNVETPVTENKKRRFVPTYTDAKEKLIKKAKSPEFKKKLSKFAKRAMAIALAAVVTFGGFKLTQTIMDKMNNPKVIEDIDSGKTTPEDIIKEEIKDVPMEEPTVEVTPVAPEEVEKEKEKVYQKTPSYNKPSNNNGNNNNNSGGNNNGTNNGGNDRDNSDEITVPDVPKVDEQPKEDAPIEAPDADIEDLPEADEDITIDDADKEEGKDEDVTITPDEDITVDDADKEDGKEDDEIIFDNKDEVEDSLEQDKEEDIVIEDAKDEPEIGGGEQAPSTDDENIKVEDADKAPDVSVPTPPAVDEDIKIEDSKDDNVSTNPVQPEAPSVENTVNVEVSNGETFNFVDSNGVNYGHDNSDNKLNNLPGNQYSKDITENSSTVKVTDGVNSNTIEMESGSLTRNHELTKDELQQLREEFANMTGNEVIEGSKSK